MFSGAERKMASLPQGSDPHVREGRLLKKEWKALPWKALKLRAHVKLLIDRVSLRQVFTEAVFDITGG